MFTLTILIIAVSFDAMSFGFAQGLKKIKISMITTLIMTSLSTLLFSVPLYLSKFISQYFYENILNLINGIILILLSIIYFVVYITNRKKITKQQDELEKNTTIMPMFIGISATLPISVDAMFTALLNGYTLDYLLFGVILYFIITFLSLLITNKMGMKLSNKTNFNLGWLSSLIFLIIGILKIFGI